MEFFPFQFKHKTMDDKRQKKFGRLIQKDLGEIFQKESNSLFNGAFITVSHVIVTPDLSFAKVYLSLMLVKNQEALMELIEEKKGYIRMLLGQRIRHQVRKVPDLIFYLDDTQAEAERIEKLFDGLDIPPADDDE